MYHLTNFEISRDSFVLTRFSKRVRTSSVDETSGSKSRARDKDGLISIVVADVDVVVGSSALRMGHLCYPGPLRGWNWLNNWPLRSGGRRRRKRRRRTRRRRLVSGMNTLASGQIPAPELSRNARAEEGMKPPPIQTKCREDSADGLIMVSIGNGKSACHIGY